MSITRFTKGPWRVDKYGNVIQSETRDGGEAIRAGGIALCMNDGEPKYNRHLIAAAPELYAELQEASNWFNSQIGFGDWFTDFEVWYKHIESLLKKARGEV